MYVCIYVKLTLKLNITISTFQNHRESGEVSLRWHEKEAVKDFIRGIVFGLTSKEKHQFI